jgi:hypothetical protein
MSEFTIQSTIDLFNLDLRQASTVPSSVLHFPSLPDDMLFRIFGQLSFMSILRLMLVCKHLYSLFPNYDLVGLQPEENDDQSSAFAPRLVLETKRYAGRFYIKCDLSGLRGIIFPKRFFICSSFCIPKGILNSDEIQIPKKLSVSVFHNPIDSRIHVNQIYSMIIRSFESIDLQSHWPNMELLGTHPCLQPYLSTILSQDFPNLRSLLLFNIVLDVDVVLAIQHLGIHWLDLHLCHFGFYRKLNLKDMNHLQELHIKTNRDDCFSNLSLPTNLKRLVLHFSMVQQETFAVIYGRSKRSLESM